MDARELKTALEVAKALVYEAGAYARERFLEGVQEVSVKEDKTWVTEVDKNIERRIKERLKEIYPNTGFWGEEYGSTEKGEYRWILDPIDGTTNFSLHVPFFNISLALEHSGNPVIGVVYNPILGEMFYALRGEGAFLNGERLKVGGNRRKTYGLCYSKSLFLEEAVSLIKLVEEKYGHIRKWGSAALEISYVALGAFDGFVGLGLKLGDFKAAQVVLEEAGGSVKEIKHEKGPVLTAWKNEEVRKEVEEMLKSLRLI